MKTPRLTPAALRGLTAFATIADAGELGEGDYASHKLSDLQAALRWIQRANDAQHSIEANTAKALCDRAARIAGYDRP